MYPRTNIEDIVYFFFILHISKSSTFQIMIICIVYHFYIITSVNIQCNIYKKSLNKIII